MLILGKVAEEYSTNRILANDLRRKSRISQEA